MTMINPYGIGAGRAIAEQYEDGPDKVRKENRRRETAAQIAERERLHARLQQGLADVPATLHGAESKNAAGTADRAQRKRLTEDERRFQERLLRDAGIAASDPTTSNARLALDASAWIDADISAQPWHRDPLSVQADARLPSSLLSCIDLSPARLTRERALSTLDSLKQALHTRRPSDLMQNESDGVRGYLDFLEGYFEPHAHSAGPSAEMASLMEGIRVQLNLAADPSTANLRQTMANAQGSADNPGRAKPVTGSEVNDHRKVLNREKHKGLEESEETDAAGLLNQALPAALLPTAATTGAGAQGSQSSPGRDSDRRREETLVSVTLKSV